MADGGPTSLFSFLMPAFQSNIQPFPSPKGPDPDFLVSLVYPINSADFGLVVVYVHHRHFARFRHHLLHRAEFPLALAVDFSVDRLLAVLLLAGLVVLGGLDR